MRLGYPDTFHQCIARRAALLPETTRISMCFFNRIRVMTVLCRPCHQHVLCQRTSFQVISDLAWITFVVTMELTTGSTAFR